MLRHRHRLGLGAAGRPATAAELPDHIAVATGLRVDIQALRGLAILLVLLHHAEWPWVPAGFLGVDIFFVISGFLITGLIDQALDDGRFTFRDFYTRRIRRLFPAAYATLTLTALVAPFLLDPLEYRDFAPQLAGAFGFFANVVLWQQSSYFGSGAALKPLLHMWSLSIEEQFYILLPPALLLCPCRLRPALVALMVLVSAGLCFTLVQLSPSATFYMLPTRAWELGLGALAALALRRRAGLRGPWPLLRLACASALLLLPLLASKDSHPGLAALLACLATAILLLPGAPGGRWQAGLAPLVWLGNRSYSLYLLHWPLFVFASHVFIGPVPPSLRALIVLASLGGAALQYRFVEQRFRGLDLTPLRLAGFVLVPLLLVGATYVASRSLTTPTTVARGGGQGLSPACDFRDRFLPLAECRSPPTQGPTGTATLLWGDSFAMALSPGLAATTSGGLIQATRSVCGPFIDLAPINHGQNPRAWGESCIRFNRSVLDYIASQPEIGTVVLSSALVQYIPGGEARSWRQLVATPEGLSEQPQDLEALLHALAATVERLRELGKRVVLFAPPPIVGLDMGRCLDRAAAGRPTVSPFPDCSYTRATYEAARLPLRDLLATIRTIGDVPVIDLDVALCGSGMCATQMDGVPLYRDGDHLSGPGSRLLGEALDWGAWVDQVAR
ncbi:acyltransferase family protein [Neoroseomonas oryzicola]|uniref:Acyltransferase n=1 Tax=Neoroseomonas oryzicola TaxID=535904 RepID=A0A9X9WP72_9PROT|nr:acyltransferase family protein [Neoroseomonas oryzicola]MBR0662132.1 acyltransferase [Neoroseomonas oryzicola]NKE20243.1 acyltransferase [Neoroseomonas oryzicola]